MAFFPGKKALSTICLYPYPKMRYHYFVTPQSNAIPLRGCLFDTWSWMTFIGSTMRFVLHSHNKTEGLSMVFAYSCASRLRLPDLRFWIRNEVRFQNEISYKNENIIWNETGIQWVLTRIWHGGWNVWRTCCWSYCWKIKFAEEKYKTIA